MSGGQAALGLAAALALASCAHGPKTDVHDPIALTEEGQGELAANKPKEALEAFEAALRIDPTSLSAVRGHIEAARRMGLLAKLAQAAEARTQTAPDDGLAWYTLGLARFAAGDEAGAVGALERAVQAMPDNADAHYRLGVALFNGEKFAQARAPLEKAVQLSPKSPRYRVPLASCLDRLGERRAAIALLAPIPELSPTPEEAKLAMQTSRVLTEPFRGVPQESRAQLEQALGYLLRNAPGLSVGPLEELIEKLPELGAAHALLGLAAERLDEGGRAMTELKRAAELSPDSPQPHAYLAELYAGHSRPEQAIAEYQEALARDPLDTATLRKLGMLEIDQPGGGAQAVRTFAKLAALLPDDDSTQLLLARAELLIPESAAAGRVHLESLAERRPEDPEVLLRLALVLLDVRAAEKGSEREETTKRAVKLTQKVLSLQPDNAAASRLLTALQTG